MRECPPRASVGQVKPRRLSRSASHLGTPRLNQSLGPSQSPTSTRNRSRSLQNKRRQQVRAQNGSCGGGRASGWWRQLTWPPARSPPPLWPGSAPSAPSLGRPAGRWRRRRSVPRLAARSDGGEGEHCEASVLDTAAAPRWPSVPQRLHLCVCRSLLTCFAERRRCARRHAGTAVARLLAKRVRATSEYTRFHTRA